MRVSLCVHLCGRVFIDPTPPLLHPLVRAYADMKLDVDITIHTPVGRFTCAYVCLCVCVCLCLCVQLVIHQSLCEKMHTDLDTDARTSADFTLRH